MGQVCPRCNAMAGDKCTRCIECGTTLFPGAAAPNRPAPRAPKAPVRPAKTRVDKPANDSEPETSVRAPLMIKLARPLARASASVAAAAPPASSSKRKDRRVAEEPKPEPRDDEPPFADRPAPTDDDSAIDAASARQGVADGVRSWMNKLLGGAMESALVPVAPEPLETIVVEPAPPAPVHTLPPPPSAIDALETQEAWDWNAAIAVPAPTAPPEPLPASVQTPIPLPDNRRVVESAPPAALELEMFAPATATYTLQILDTRGQWRDWGPIHAGGLNVGRAKDSADFPGLSSMAVRHMRFRYNRGMLVVEDLGSLNGIYLRLTQPAALVDGTRFRIGGQTIEFREAKPFLTVPATVSDDGEEYCSRDIAALAYVELVRPNGRPGLRFPITKHDPTVIGREGPNATIALPDDHSVSASHAQLRREDDAFYLEDLKSRNGTFIQIRGASPVQSGDVILAGRALFRIVEQRA